MLKKIFSPRNIILAFLIVAFLAVLAGQQSVLNEKRAQYAAAKAESETLAREAAELDLKKQLINSETAEEERARKSGYIYPDEYLIDYGED